MLGESGKHALEFLLRHRTGQTAGYQHAHAIANGSTHLLTCTWRVAMGFQREVERRHEVVERVEYGAIHVEDGEFVGHRYLLVSDRSTGNVITWSAPRARTSLAKQCVRGEEDVQASRPLTNGAEAGIMHNQLVNR